jgi:hypothetical protein
VEYFAIPSTISNFSNKLVKTSHPTSEMVVRFNVNHEENVLRVLADTGSRSSIILEAFTSENLFKCDEEQNST